jgi:predicted transcriptional regulator
VNAEVIRLREEGLTFHQIWKRTGIAPSTAHKMVRGKSPRLVSKGPQAREESRQRLVQALR